ncbi:hypothetical protein [Deinococcus multiflagellatus]|uniref:Uncharacterized protein n=1 Tax=Deinococcus multiflagellatus TaxID=1656887 RepID=A0ABW1ZTL8_9DEIO|nr:hypothetical protein [Deinococcus multiflagellatus]MBZ9715915.1 hypothetical protein [Deinococcus multiflagellatus]
MTERDQALAITLHDFPARSGPVPLPPKLFLRQLRQVYQGTHLLLDLGGATARDRLTAQANLDQAELLLAQARALPRTKTGARALLLACDNRAVAGDVLTTCQRRPLTGTLFELFEAFALLGAMGIRCQGPDTVPLKGEWTAAPVAGDWRRLEIRYACPLQGRAVVFGHARLP